MPAAIDAAAEGRDLSSRQRNTWLKDLGDWETYKLRKGSETAEALHAKAKAEVLSESRMREDLHVRFDERDVETESRSNH